MSLQRTSPDYAVKVPEDASELSTDTYDPTRSLVKRLETLESEVEDDEGSTRRLEKRSDLDDSLPLLQPKTPSFIVRQVLGRGAFGVVHEAHQLSLKRTVALKKLRPELLTGKRRRELLLRSFQSEAYTAAQLDHPNIVPVYELCLDDQSIPMLAMKVVKGGTWDSMLDHDFALLDAETFLAKHLPILMSVSRAVAFAHSRGIVHRDLKPSQIVLGEYGEVLLTDWGLAVVYDEKLLYDACKSIGMGAAPSLNTAGSPAGTPAYMAPEQTEPTADHVGPWTDVYLLGGILYNILTGRCPHQGDGKAKLWYMASEGVIIDPAESAPNRCKPPELLSLMLDALQPSFFKRTLTAKQFATRIEDYLTGASRRRQSQDITKELDDRLAREEQGYRGFADLLARLNDAASLWHDNPQVAPLRQRLLTEYARAALRHGDLMLARVQGEELPTGDTRETLLLDVRNAERSAKSQRRRLRAAVLSVLALLTVLLVTSLAVSREFQQQRDTEKGLREEAERARMAAAMRADDSFVLVEFLIKGVGEHLDPQLPRDQELIAQVGDQVVNHFRDLDLSGETGESKSRHAATMLTVAASLGEMGRIEDAVTLARIAAGMLSEIKGAGSRQSRRAHSDLGSYLLQLGHVDEARTMLADVSRHLEKLPETANWHERWLNANRTGDLNRQTGQWPEAEQCYDKALEYAATADDPTSAALFTANTNLDLAGLYNYMGRREEAGALMLQALETQKEILGPDSPQVVNALYELAGNLKDRGRLDEAQETFLEVKATWESTMIPNHPRFVLLWQRLAEIEYIKRNFDAAKDYYNQALALAEQTYGPDYYYLAPLLQGLGNIAFLQYRYDEAAVFFERAYEIQIRRHGPDSPYLPELCMSLGALYSQLKDPRAEEFFRKALDVTRKHYSPEHPNLGASLINLATYYTFEERFTEAEPLIDEALANLRQAYGPEHSYFGTAVGMALQTKCWIARALEGDARQAKWEETLDLYEANNDAIPTPILRAYHAEALLRLGRKDEAIRAFADRSLQGVSDQELERYFIESGMLDQSDLQMR